MFGGPPDHLGRYGRGTYCSLQLSVLFPSKSVVWTMPDSTQTPLSWHHHSLSVISRSLSKRAAYGDHTSPFPSKVSP
jgi:hypothetical protein